MRLLSMRYTLLSGVVAAIVSLTNPMAFAQPSPPCARGSAVAGAINEFPLPTANSNPLGITHGPDCALWFTEDEGNRIGRITVTGEITEFAIPTANSEPSRITTGPDGALWFTEFTGEQDWPDNDERRHHRVTPSSEH